MFDLGAPELIIIAIVGLIPVAVVVLVIVLVVNSTRQRRVMAEQLAQLHHQQQTPGLPPGAPQGHYDAFPEPPGPGEAEQPPADRRQPGVG